MRQMNMILLGVLLAVSLPACAPTLVENDGNLVTDPIGSVVAAAGDETPPAPAPADAAAPSADNDPAAPADTDAALATTPGEPTQLRFTGRVVGSNDYQLFDLSAIGAGSRCAVLTDLTVNRDSFLVVFLDEQLDLLYRGKATYHSGFDHLARDGAIPRYLGVTPAYSTGGGDFAIELTVRHNQAVPAPAQQVVWVNFAGGSGVTVHGRSPISFPAFDAGTLGLAYRGRTDAMKATIIQAMRHDYAPYNVVILSSDETSRPAGPHAVVHIGGSDSRLLGLADHVDQYNESLSDTAVVYVEGFADFSVMLLEPDEMAQMIGNTASHELGHLLGLFHTTSHVDLMDTTGSAWDLVRDQAFSRGALEPSVFPTGFENSPARLFETVGANPDPAAKQAATSSLDADQLLRKAELRSLIQNDLRCRCGNCLNPDG